MQQENRISVCIRVKDRVGIVSEITGIMYSLQIDIRQHGAKVVHDRSGATSVFQAEIIAEPDAVVLLRKRCRRLRGFLDIELHAA